MKKLQKYSIFPEAFFSVWALSRICSLSTRSILTPIFFLFTTYFFQKVRSLYGKNDHPQKHIRITAAISAFLFTMFFLLARSDKLTEGLSMPLFHLIILFVSGIGLFFLFYYVLFWLYVHAVSYKLSKESASPHFLPLLTFFACLLGWLPYFLYEYPAIMTPDSINQLEQVLGMVPYSNHHPWTHTMVLHFFYSLGYSITHNPNTALAFFTIFQMCFMAFCVSYLISTLRRLSVKNTICILIVAFYALTPYHAVFAVTIWKDVMFSGAVLLFTTALLRLLFLNTMHPDILLYVLSGIMMCLFRTNGWYAFLLSLPFLLYAFYRRGKYLALIHIPILATVLFIKLILMDLLGVTQPDFVESISIPLQQVSYVICQDDELTEPE